MAAPMTLFPPMTEERREALRVAENERRELAAMLNDHLCGECGAPLVTGSNLDDQEIRHWFLVCGQDRGHTGFRRLHSATEAYRRGEAVSPYVEQILARKGLTRMTSQALEKMTEQQMLARVEQARFPQQMDAGQKKLLAVVAISYGLDPLLGELSIFQGRPYVSIDGRYRKAQETGKLGGVETRPATADEREAWQIPDGDYFFRSEVRRCDVAYPFVGWGRVRAEETKAPAGGRAGFRPLETNPQRMAEKRAEAQALRKAFSIPLPSAEFAGTPEDEPAVEAEVRELDVDTETGEVCEPPEDTEPADVGHAQSAPLAPPKLTCLKDLTDAAKATYGLAGPHVYRILGIKSSLEVGDLEAAWAKIVASQEG